MAARFSWQVGQNFLILLFIMHNWKNHTGFIDAFLQFWSLLNI